MKTLEETNKKMDDMKTHTRQALNEFFFNPNPIMMEELLRWCYAYQRARLDRDAVLSRLEAK